MVVCLATDIYNGVAGIWLTKKPEITELFWLDRVSPQKMQPVTSGGKYPKSLVHIE